MVAEAASTTGADLELVEEHGSWTEIDNQTLTVVFAGTRPAEAPCGWESELPAPEEPPIIESLGGQWTIGELQRCLAPPKRGILDRLIAGFRTGDDDPLDRPMSLLWSEFITHVEVTANGEVANGVVVFERPGCFTGRVSCSLRRSLDGWAVDSFDLADTGWGVKRDEKGRWAAFAGEGLPVLPDLGAIEGILNVDLEPTVVGGFQVRVDRQVIPVEGLGEQVAGQVVVLRTNDGVEVEQYINVIRIFQEAEPPVLALFSRTGRMIDGCWCLLGVGKGWQMKQLLSDNTLASAVIEVFRTQVPREAISLCVGDQGIAVRCPGAAPIRAEDSVRDAVWDVISVVRRRPDLPVVISTGPGARFHQLDLAMDIAVRSEARNIFLHTSDLRGVVFNERKDQGCGSPNQPRTR